MLDTTSKTVKNYGIESWPTVVVLDPEGRVVDLPDSVDLHPEDSLASKLPPLPVAKRIAQALDRDLRLVINDDFTLAELMAFYERFDRIKIRMSKDAMKAAGIDKGDRLPLKLGGGHTLRAYLNLALDPVGLTYVADGDGLLVVPRTRNNGDLSRPSPRQEFDNARVAEALKQKVTFEFRGESLANVVEALEAKTGESFVLDLVARRRGAIKADATATGTAADEPLGAALARLLELLGMTSVDRDEAVVLTTMR